jgi:hypothetical protein
MYVSLRFRLDLQHDRQTQVLGDSGLILQACLRVGNKPVAKHRSCIGHPHLLPEEPATQTRCDVSTVRVPERKDRRSHRPDQWRHLRCRPACGEPVSPPPLHAIA